MGRYERTRYFDRLCELRDSYGDLPEDTRGTISIADVLIDAEAVMTALIEHDRENAIQELAVEAERVAEAETIAEATEAAIGDSTQPDTKPLGKFGPFGRFQGNPGRNRT